MINNNSNSLKIIKETVNKILPDSKILLFGSRARNNNDFDSDYDILIISKTALDIPIKRAFKSLIRKVLARKKIPVDVLIHSEDEVEYKKEINGHILKQVFNEGVFL